MRAIAFDPLDLWSAIEKADMGKKVTRDKLGVYGNQVLTLESGLKWESCGSNKKLSKKVLKKLQKMRKF